MDFFVIPTATFQLPMASSSSSTGATHPTAEWTCQQLREAFPFDTAPRFLHRDRDGIYGNAVTATIKAMGIEEVLSAPRSPWQNPYCERAIGTLRRELLDHLIVLSEAHARRPLKEYVEYYNGSRTHLALDKDAPESRTIEPPSVGVVAARECSVASTIATSAARRKSPRQCSVSLGHGRGVSGGVSTTGLHGVRRPHRPHCDSPSSWVGPSAVTLLSLSSDNHVSFGVFGRDRGQVAEAV